MYNGRMKVWCPSCKEYIPAKKAKYINIEEGDRGQDVVTFDCKICNAKSVKGQVVS
jgi:hypothetical protein